ncbi:MAG: hypothetical protein GQ565_03050 [Candidatus Aegiribacteria sp.]|nr:hypothetical protein [Candidatus Aegiribacteria sp.]
MADKPITVSNPLELIAATKSYGRPGPQKTRQFDSGATRDQDTTKFDYEGFFSPLTMRARAEYMHKHRKQSDGAMRDSDNWQKGMPLSVYIKSFWRHFMDLWFILRGYPMIAGQATDQSPPDLMEALCGAAFNIDGMIHEEMKKRLGIAESTK